MCVAEAPSYMGGVSCLVGETIGLSARSATVAPAASLAPPVRV